MWTPNPPNILILALLLASAAISVAQGAPDCDDSSGAETGQVLLRKGARGGLSRAFQQISDELRSQYLLTFYTDRPIDDLNARDIEIQVPSPKKTEVRAVLAWDQVR